MYGQQKITIRRKASGNSEFQASKGWFQRFKKKTCLHNVKLTGESAGAQKFTTKLAGIIEEEIIPDT